MIRANLGLARTMILLMAALSLPSATYAALVATNGDFEANAQGNGAASNTVANWFQSSVDGTHFFDFVFNSSTNFTSGNTKVGLAFDPNKPVNQDLAWGWIYQSLGFRGTGDDLLAVTFDAFKRNAGTGFGRRFGNVEFSFYSGNFPGAANGTDIATAGLTLLGSFVISGNDDLGFDETDQFLAQQNLSYTPGTQIDLTGIAVGTQVWMKIAHIEPHGVGSSSLYEAFLDNISVTTSAVPEPPTLLLAIAALLACCGSARTRMKSSEK